MRTPPPSATNLNVVKPWEPDRLRMAVAAAGVALWSWNVDTDLFTMDEQAYGLWGVPVCTQVTFEHLSACMHPADRDRVDVAFSATRGVIGDYEIDFRILKDGEVRWISARGQGNDADIVDRIMFGIFLDVTGRKQAEEAHELLAGEMSHRVKNLLSIASALTSLTSKSAATTVEMANDLTQRLSALGRAHDLVRPVAGGKENGALLADLLSILLAPYDDAAAFSGRMRISVPRMTIGETAATTLALVIHELATNSVKYGALAAQEGLLDLSCPADADPLVLIWTERGGPKVTAPTGPGGFGSKLISRSMSSQLGGSIHTDWAQDGVVITLKMDKAELSK